MFEIFIGILIPFVGTSLGAACVLFMKGGLNQKVQKALAGFAAGVMVAASVWSLLIPSIDMANEQKIIAWLPATIGLLLGISVILFVSAFLMLRRERYASL